MKFVQMGIWCLSVLVFLGYIMVWIMMPTTTFFLHWLPYIHAKTDSIYFGNQGTNMLVYTFPILFIATLACLYLNLERKHSDHNTKRKWGFLSLASGKKPVLVKGPLGIISWTELFFVTMFVSLLIWSFYSYLHALFANVTQQAANQREHVWEAKLEYSALALGLVGNICLTFLFFPVSRGSSILHLIGLTSEACIKYHIWMGHVTMALFTAHGVCYLIFWVKTDQMTQVLIWSKIGVSNVAGEISLLSGLIMWAATFPRIRRKAFELFFYTHHLYIVFVVFFVLHVGFSYSCIMLPGFYIFLIDRYLRFLQSQQRIQLVSARVLPCEAVELNFSKQPGLYYVPTSIIFINIPSISKLQWHPFSITSNADTDPDTLSIVIKSAGSWSQTLYQKLSSSSPLVNLEVSVEGPHGPPSTIFSRHDVLVMISGGSGITPLISIIRDLLSKADTEGGKVPRVLLISAFKKSVDLTMLDLLLPVSHCNLDISHLQLQIEAYITREKQPAANDRKLLQTIWFKPGASNAPLSAILGQKSWLYLGTIISSSFILYLLLSAILTRYYIYPIDHNSNMIYAYFSRSSLSMLFLCVSVAIAATAAFLWNKKQNKMLKLVKNMHSPSPMTSPGSELHNGDRELESLPLHSFLQATKVHYGERPNLKKIVADCEGSSIGVVVSGPRKMRREVATICRASLRENIHFESISFSW